MRKTRDLWLAAACREFPIEQRYLVGVSGGRDSVALLHALLAQGYRKLLVCHLDHGLRGRAAKADASFVVRLAERNQLLCEIGSTDVRELARREKLSIETAARAARYAFFARVAARRRCHTIFLGHHADDLVETFLINLFRGAGAAGLASLREVSNHRFGEREFIILRPMLGVWRNEIDRYCQSNELKYREDKTNLELGPLRNRVRHRLLPYLAKIFGRDIRQNIWRAAAIAAEENAWMNSLIPGFEAELSVERLRTQSVAAQRRALHIWLRQHEVVDIGFDLIERVRALLEPGCASAKTNLPRDRHVRRRAKKLFIDG